MIHNFLKMAWRKAVQNRLFSIINLLGLSIGLAASLATLLYVKKGLSYDTFQKNYDNIYQVCLNTSFDDIKFEKWSSAPNKVGPYLKAHLPEIRQQVRILHHDYGNLSFISTGEKHLPEKKLYYADQSILEIFDFKLNSGDIKTALSRPNTAIISKETAQRYFGVVNPIGKTINIDNSFDIEITGVFEPFEGNSHLDYNILASFETMKWASNPDAQTWSNASFETFLLLNPNTNISNLGKKIEDAISKEAPRKDRFYDVFLRPLNQVHLYSNDFTNKIDAPYGDARQINILIVLAIALLLIAAINYMNLSTARLQRSFREVGINKVLGANVGQMTLRFFAETFLFVTTGLLLSILILSISLPSLNKLTEEYMTYAFLQEKWFWSILGTIWISLILLSGAYPAINFARLSPKFMLQSVSLPKTSTSLLRKGMVVFQFTASVILIVMLVAFNQQIEFLRNKNLGFNKEHVVGVMVSNLKDKAQFDALENEIKSLSAVKQAAFVQAFPGVSTSLRTLANPKKPNESSNLYTTRTRPEIIETLDLKIIAGKTLEKKLPSDTTVQLVVNKKAVEYLGLTPEQAIGKKFNVFTEYGDEIVGVVEDFHFQSLHQQIVPFAFHNARTESYTYLMVRLNTNDILQNMASLEKTYKKVIPNSAFEYVFLNDHIDNLYTSEKRIAKVVSIFAILAIFVACLGLFGLTTFSAEVRTKEIGIRKTLGANVINIVNLLARDFMALVMLALLFATPIAYYFINTWLQNFAYHVPISWSMFLFAGVLVIILALFTISYQAIKAAMANPIHSLKSE